MAIREFRRTGQTSQWDYQAFAAYLAGKGYVVGPGGVGTALDATDPSVVIVRADIDPHVPDATVQADVDAYVPASDPVAAAQVAYRQAIRDLRATDQTTTAAQYVAILKRCQLASAALRGL